MSESLLQLSRVTKTFGGINALTDMALDVPKGKIVGVIGPNGAGKTTLFPRSPPPQPSPARPDACGP